MAIVRAWRLAAVLFPSGGRGVAEALNGTWRLAAREVRQAIWNQVLPSDARGTPGGFGCRVGL